MTIDINIMDAEGSSIEAGVTKYHALKVTHIDPELWPTNKNNRYEFFSTYLTLENDGVTTNMNLDGSSSEKHFYYTLGDIDYDIYIKTIIFVMSDSTMLLKNFGSLSSLTNGFSLYIKNNNNDTYIIDSAKTVGELIVKTGVPNPYGSGSDLYILKNYIGNTDAIVLRINIEDYVPGGIRLGRSSTDEICTLIKDNLTVIDLLNVFVIGYKFLP